MEKILGVLLLLLCILAIVKIAGSSATVGMKVVWILVVLLLPILGLILWWFLGPK